MKIVPNSTLYAGDFAKLVTSPRSFSVRHGANPAIYMECEHNFTDIYRVLIVRRDPATEDDRFLIFANEYGTEEVSLHPVGKLSIDAIKVYINKGIPYFPWDEETMGALQVQLEYAHTTNVKG